MFASEPAPSILQTMIVSLSLERTRQLTQGDARETPASNHVAPGSRDRYVVSHDHKLHVFQPLRMCHQSRKSKMEIVPSVCDVSAETK